MTQLLVCSVGEESLPMNKFASHCDKLNIPCPAVSSLKAFKTYLKEVGMPRCLSCWCALLGRRALLCMSLPVIGISPTYSAQQ